MVGLVVGRMNDGRQSRLSCPRGTGLSPAFMKCTERTLELAKGGSRFGVVQLIAFARTKLRPDVSKRIRAQHGDLIASAEKLRSTAGDGLKVGARLVERLSRLVEGGRWNGPSMSAATLSRVARLTELPTVQMAQSYFAVIYCVAREEEPDGELEVLARKALSVLGVEDSRVARLVSSKSRGGQKFSVSQPKGQVRRTILAKTLVPLLTGPIRDPIAIWGTRDSGKTTIVNNLAEYLGSAPSVTPIPMQLSSPGATSLLQILAYIANGIMDATRGVGHEQDDMERCSKHTLLRLMQRVAAASRSQHFVVLLDDYDLLFDINRSLCMDFFSTLRSIFKAPKKGVERFTFVLAGTVHHTRHKLAHSPLYNIMHRCELGPMQADELLHHAKAYGLHDLNRGEADEVSRVTGGFPAPSVAAVEAMSRGASLTEALQSIASPTGEMSELCRRILDRVERSARRRGVDADIYLARIRNAVAGHPLLDTAEYYGLVECGLLELDAEEVPRLRVPMLDWR